MVLRVFKVGLGFSFLLLPVLGLAYIPSAEMVFSRLKDQQGRGWYKITQKVTFLETSRFTKSFQFDEILWKGPKSTFLEVKSPDVPSLNFTFLYKESSKQWKDSGVQQNFKTNQFIESYFSPRIPNWLNSLSSLDLGRALGVVNYVFKDKNKTVWIEQDEFVVRQIQVSTSQKETYMLKAKNYQIFSRGLFFPRVREFTFEDYKIKFELVHVEPLSKFSPKKLIENKWESPSLDQGVDLVRNFYNNFR